MSDIKIELAPKMAELFEGDYIIRGAYGGRGSTKSVGFCQMVLAKAIFYACCGVSGSMLCARQFQVSIQKSTLAELKVILESNPSMRRYFDVGERYLKTVDSLPGSIEFDFIGLDKNLESLKSKSKVLICFIDEAETVSEEAFQYLLPTLRTSGTLPNGSKYHSEIWLAWNPKSAESAVYKRFVEKTPSIAKIIQINWRDNPWWHENVNLQAARMADYEILDRARANWIWEGELLRNSETQVLHGKVSVQVFEPDEKRWHRYQGLDYGFANDPTAAVVAWVDPQHPEYLYVSHESGKVHLEIAETGEYILNDIPDFDKYVTRADCARPETTSHLVKHGGLPRVVNVSKTKIEDGISHLRSFKSIIIHPRCKELVRETDLYSYKTNSGGDILPDVVDKFNHYIDALRYAVVPLVKQTGRSRIMKRK